MKRTFIAIKVKPGHTLLKAFTDINEDLQNEEIKWVKPDDFHITLKFLGNTNNHQLQDINVTLSELLSGLSPFSFILTGMGYFGRKKEPTVIWTGTGEDDNLMYLRKLIDDKLLPFGFHPDKVDYNAHLTLGRIKRLSNHNHFFQIIDRYKRKFFQELVVDRIVIFESILTHEGPTYIPVYEYKLL